MKRIAVPVLVLKRYVGFFKFISLFITGIGYCFESVLTEEKLLLTFNCNPKILSIICLFWFIFVHYISIVTFRPWLLAALPKFFHYRFLLINIWSEILLQSIFLYLRNLCSMIVFYRQMRIVVIPVRTFVKRTEKKVGQYQIQI